jgi:hypothetical protein
MLIMNIFPQGRTLLHYLWDNTEEIKNTFERLDKLNKDLKIPYVLPFIKNFNGESPLHLCLKNQNLQSLNTFLMLIKDDPIDTHGRAIIEILPDILELELPGFYSYLENRIVETPMLNRIDKGCLLKNFSDSDYQLYTTEQWSNDVLLK